MQRMKYFWIMQKEIKMKTLDTQSILFHKFSCCFHPVALKLDLHGLLIMSE